jgi:hypothetical protein
VKSLNKIIIALAVLAPARLFACATCYGNGANINDPMVDGMNWAILTLGVVVATVLGTFLAYFIYIMRKGEMLEAAAQQTSSVNALKTRSRRSDEGQTQDNMEHSFGSPEPAKV